MAFASGVGSDPATAVWSAMMNLKGFFLLHKENSSWRRSRFTWVQPQICLRRPSSSLFVYLRWQQETHGVMWLIWFILYYLFIYFFCSESAAISQPGCRGILVKKIWEGSTVQVFSSLTFLDLQLFLVKNRLYLISKIRPYPQSYIFWLIVGYFGPVFFCCKYRCAFYYNKEEPFSFLFFWRFPFFPWDKFKARIFLWEASWQTCWGH